MGRMVVLRVMRQERPMPRSAGYASWTRCCFQPLSSCYCLIFLISGFQHMFIRRFPCPLGQFTNFLVRTDKKTVVRTIYVNYCTCELREQLNNPILALSIPIIFHTMMHRIKNGRIIILHSFFDILILIFTCICCHP
jgi:hypothetical protein